MVVLSERAAAKRAKQDFWELRLYVAGQTVNCVRAFANLKQICETHLEGKYRIQVIDLIRNPPSRRWSANCRCRSEKSSATCRTPRRFWWDSTWSPERSDHGTTDPPGDNAL